MVIGSLDVDGLGESALPLGFVVGHVGHEVGVAAVALAHHPVLVIAKVGGFQPQSAILFIGAAPADQSLHGAFDPAIGVEAAFQVIVVELQPKRLQVLVLFVAQISHGKLADVVEVVHFAAGSEGPVVGMYCFLGQKVVGNVLDVVAVVGGFRPLRVARFEALGTQLHRLGQRGDLHAGIVVIKLPCYQPALRGQQVANGVAQRGLAAVADVQRTSGVGADELDQDLVVSGGLHAVAAPRGQHFTHSLLLGFGFEANVQKARTGNFDRRNPLLKIRSGFQCCLELFPQRARILFERLGQLHGGVGGPVAVCGLLGGFKRSLVARSRAELLQLGRQCGKEFFLDLLHGALL